MTAKHAKHAKAKDVGPAFKQVPSSLKAARQAPESVKSNASIAQHPVSAGFRDVHCHILPAVDDGSRSLEESRQMLAAAAQAGITSIVCTPHCRGSRFSQSACLTAYDSLCEFADDLHIHMAMAYEVYYNKLLEIGVDKAGLLRNAETDELLLELPTGQMPMDVDRTIFQLQASGLNVVIAHPERYAYVQDDISIAQDWVDSGCTLQASADFIEGGMRSGTKKVAKQMMQRGMYTYLASDAHEPGHYKVFRQCMGKYWEALRPALIARCCMND